MPNVNIEVVKNQNENNASLLRRFTRRMNEAGIVKKAKSKRYSARAQSAPLGQEKRLEAHHPPRRNRKAQKTRQNKRTQRNRSALIPVMTAMRRIKEEFLSIKNLTKGRLPRLPFSDMKKKILGEGYDLSIVFVGATRSRELNRRMRGKDKPANVLSFPLSPSSGELMLCPAEAKRGAPEFDMDYSNFLAFLTIHGMLHLKGLEHGAIMERQEEKFCEQFLI